MRKIMLIDDRTIRQIKFMEETGIDINAFSDVMDNFTDDKYEVLLDEFRNDNFSILNNYDVIITHRSAYGEINSKVLDKFKEICKQEKKSLVFFSGGISSITYFKQPFEFLLVNSQMFYSKTLELFLENYKETFKVNILQIPYGNRWNINILLNTLEKINRYIGENLEKQSVSYIKFKIHVELKNLNDILDYEEPKLENGMISMETLKHFSQNLSNQIKKKVVINV